MKSVAENNLVGKDLYFDNYFSSVALFKELQYSGIGAIGTFRQNHKFFSKELIVNNKELAQGEYKFRTSKGIFLLVWMDKKPVYFGTNHINPNLITQVSRRNKDGFVSSLSCPEILRKYKSWVGGVDMADQFIQYCVRDRKSYRWMINSLS